MKTRIQRTKRGFRAQYTRDNSKWVSVSGFSETELDAALSLAWFIADLKVSSVHTTYIGLVETSTKKEFAS